MMRIDQIDPNFRVNSDLPEGYEYFDPRKAPFQLYCVAPNAEGSYNRLPISDPASQIEGVHDLAGHLSGACVRFSTDSEGLCILWELAYGGMMPHFALSGQCGMELFEETDGGTIQVKQLLPAPGQNGARPMQSAFVQLPGGMRHYVLYFPLYNGFKQFSLGFAPGARIERGRTPRIVRPMLFYGSSITQGGCATKTGNCYTNLLARRLDAALHCLGFAGRAKGETDMARCIARMEMSVFIMDYDHNAPDAEYLEKTHEPFFRIIREAQPDLPIVLMSRPDFDQRPEACRARRDVILRTYVNAVAKGDKNVYFVDGESCFGPRDRDLCTVDGCHPNDLGFLRMADTLEPVLRRILYP